MEVLGVMQGVLRVIQYVGIGKLTESRGRGWAVVAGCDCSVAVKLQSGGLEVSAPSHPTPIQPNPP